MAKNRNNRSKNNSKNSSRNSSGRNSSKDIIKDSHAQVPDDSPSRSGPGGE